MERNGVVELNFDKDVKIICAILFINHNRFSQYLGSMTYWLSCDSLQLDQCPSTYLHLQSHIYPLKQRKIKLWTSCVGRL